MLYGGLEHLMWPVLFGTQKTDVNLVADRYTDMLLNGIQPSKPLQVDAVEARLQRLEDLLIADRTKTKNVR